MIRKIIFLIFLYIMFSNTAQSEISDSGLGSLWWEAYICSTYAWEMGNEEEGGRLFGIGYAAGHLFYEAFSAGKITDEETNQTPKVIRSTVKGGGSYDFVSGRILGRAEGYAIIMGNGSKIKTVWKDLYRQANCYHLGRSWP